MIAVEMRGITKKFPNVLALDNVSIKVKSGSIHALLGENGAGKTTLMNILFGIYRPDKGEIFLKGRKVSIRSPADAMSLGIGMVHQHFKLVETLSVSENIALSLRKKVNEAREIVKNFCRKYGFEINPDAKIWQLSVGEQQRVEIIKAVSSGADVLILDEPTSVLTPNEVKKLFKIFRQMKKEGKAIIFITHKLDEVFMISERVTVLRKGKVVFESETKKTNKRQLARKMVGRKITLGLKKHRRKKGRVLLEVKNLTVLNDMGLPVVNNISFKVFEGEILGIAGIAGNGQKELVEALTGLRKAKGKVRFLGEDITNKNPAEIYRKGVVHIPEDRLNMGVVPTMTVTENFLLTTHHFKPFFIDSNLEKEVQNVLTTYKISARPRTKVKLLSGGNIQRLIIAREFSKPHKLVIASHPTYGLDIASSQHVRKLLEKERTSKKGVLLVSEDLDELLKLSDRIIVLSKGRIVGEVKHAKKQTIGLMMGR